MGGPGRPVRLEIAEALRPRWHHGRHLVFARIARSFALPPPDARTLAEVSSAM
jgi:hypothetical protein